MNKLHLQEENNSGLLEKILKQVKPASTRLEWRRNEEAEKSFFTLLYNQEFKLEISENKSPRKAGDCQVLPSRDYKHKLDIYLLEESPESEESVKQIRISRYTNADHGMISDWYYEVAKKVADEEAEDSIRNSPEYKGRLKFAQLLSS